MDFTATQTAELTDISRRSVNSIYALFRIRVQQWVNKQAPFNGIESFWSYAKWRLARFNGFRHTHFILHLKETEFRFNYRNNDLYSVMLKHLRADPL